MTDKEKVRVIEAACIKEFQKFLPPSSTRWDRNMRDDSVANTIRQFEVLCYEAADLTRLLPKKWSWYNARYKPQTISLLGSDAAASLQGLRQFNITGAVE